MPRRARTGESVAVTLDGVTQQARVGPGGAFSTTFSAAGLTASGSPYTVGYAYAGDGTYDSESTISSLSVTPGPLMVSLSVSPGSIEYGQPLTFVATATGSGGTPSGTITFMDGTRWLGLDQLDASGRATYTLHGVPVGTDSLTAVYGGDADFPSMTSAPVDVTVARAPTKISLVWRTTAKGVSLEADVKLMPGSGGENPTGTVSFTIKHKVFVATIVSPDEATVTVAPGLVKNRTVLVNYSGDGNFLPGTMSAKVTMKKAPMKKGGASYADTDGRASVGQPGRTGRPGAPAPAMRVRRTTTKARSSRSIPCPCRGGVPSRRRYRDRGGPRTAARPPAADARDAGVSPPARGESHGLHRDRHLRQHHRHRLAAIRGQ